MRLFRIEHAVSKNGMWTQRVGSGLVLNELSDTRLSELPMPTDVDSFQKNNEEWKTAVSTMNDMSYWFTVQDVKEMVQHGFMMIEFEAHEVQVQENQVLFVARKRFGVRDITQDWLFEMMKG